MRIFFIHHVTWSINSVCHFFGQRRFDVEDKSTNVAWLAIPTFGESWHHNHHAFPRSARQGLGKFEVDISAMLIWAMEKVGIAKNVVRITPERQLEKLIEHEGREGSGLGGGCLRVAPAPGDAGGELSAMPDIRA